MALHKSLGIGEIHVPHQWEYADSTARGAATGFLPTDVGKLARQLDDNTLWILTDDSPVTWVAVAGSGGVTPHKATHQHGGGDEVATATPAANAIPKADASSKLDSWVTSGAAAATPSLRALGTSATEACAGNDSRLSDARTPTAHKTTHESGGGDAISHQNLSGAGTNAHSAIDTHLGSTSNPHSTTASQVGLGSVTNDAQLKRAAGDFATFTEKTTLVSADLFLIEDSADSGNKKKVQYGNTGSIFGRDYSAQASEGESTTTSATFQDKVTLTTGALTGTYRVNWNVEMKTSASNKFPQVRLYNDTDAAELGFSQRTFSNAEIYDLVSGYANVTFTGVAKTFKIQFANTAAGTTTVRRARLSVWRVS